MVSLLGISRGRRGSSAFAAKSFHSFVSDEWGDFVSEAGAKDHGALVATLDLERARIHRAGMGFFRDRRPELYARIAQDI